MYQEDSVKRIKPPSRNYNSPSEALFCMILRNLNQNLKMIMNFFSLSYKFLYSAECFGVREALENEALTMSQSHLSVEGFRVKWSACNISLSGTGSPTFFLYKLKCMSKRPNTPRANTESCHSLYCHFLVSMG